MPTTSRKSPYSSLFLRKRGRTLKYRALGFLCALAALSLYANYQGPLSLENDFAGDIIAPSSSRSLSSIKVRDEDPDKIDTSCKKYTDVCSLPECWWGLVIYLLGTLYLFVGIAVICDDYFTDALYVICDKLNLSEDVAGATFMAAGSSAPELFTAVADAFGTKNSIGVGTIVGSAVFNLVCICGLSAVVPGETLSLDWRPLARDASFYFISICLLVLTLMDGKVYGYESVFFLLVYAIYITYMYFNEKIVNYLCPGSGPSGDNAMDAAGVEAVQLEEDPETMAGLKEEEGMVVGGNPSSDDYEGDQGAAAGDGDGDDDDDDEEPHWLMAILEAPWRFAFTYTVPQCTEEKWESWYMVSFFMSIMWIGLTSYFMAAWATIIGCMLGLNAGLMGLTLVAAGTSIPDALGSIAVAREGHGDMAVSNAIGSNVFDILLGLGLPWTISILMVYRKPIEVSAETHGVLLQAFVQLVGTLVVLLASLAYCKFELSPKLGYFLMSLYVLFIITSFATNRG